MTTFLIRNNKLIGTDILFILFFFSIPIESANRIHIIAEYAKFLLLGMPFLVIFILQPVDIVSWFLERRVCENHEGNLNMISWPKLFHSTIKALGLYSFLRRYHNIFAQFYIRMSASAVAELITKAFVLWSTGRIVHLQEQKFLIFKKKI